MKSTEKVLEIAEKEDAHSFDVSGSEFDHKGSKCTFDVMIDAYGLDDPALLLLARIVNGADTNNQNPPPESAGLKAIAFGFSMIELDDNRKIELEMPMYDALYEWCKRRLGK